MVRFKKQDGSIVEVHETRVEDFKMQFPNAVIIESQELVKTTPVVPDAVAGEEIASDMALPSDPGLSDLVGPSEIPEPDTSFVPFESPEAAKTAEEEIKLERENENQVARDFINTFLLEKGIQPELAGRDEGELTETTAFEETKRISKSEIEAREKRVKEAEEVALGEKELSELELVTNTLGNQLGRLTTFDDTMKWAWAWLGKQTNGYDIYASDYDKDYWDTKLGEAEAEIERVNSYAAPVAEFTGLGEKKGVKKLTYGAAAVIDGAANVVSSLLISAPTLGIGLGAEMITRSVQDYNSEKAQRLGLNSAELIDQGEAEVAIPAALGTFGFALEKIGLNRQMKYINAMSYGSKKQFYQWLLASTFEGGTEFAQLGIETFNTELGKDKSVLEAGKKAFNTMFSPVGLEALLKGAFGSAVVTTSGRNLKAAVGLRTSTENENIQNTINEIADLEISKYRKNLTPEDIGRINKAQNELRADLMVGYNKNQELVNVLNESEINQINLNLNTIENSQKEIQSVINSDKYTQENKNIIIKSLNKEIEKAKQDSYDIRNTAEKITQSTETIKEKATEIKGVQVKDFETTKEVEDFVKQQNPDQDTTKASEQQGFIVQNPNTGEQTIVINKEVAKQEKAVNVAAHEFLHAILYKTVKDSPETSINLGNALLNELNKIDASKIKDSKFKKRMEQYADQSKEVQMEEALTLFSDAIATGDIKFSENVFTKMGDVIRRSLQKLGVNIKFNNGRDVYNFVKDYNASIAKGDLSLAQVKAAARGVEGKLVTPKQQEQEIETIIKESKSDSDAVQAIFEQKGKEGAFEIIEKFKPITNRIVQRRSEAPGFDRQLLTDEIETGKRGIIDLINEYDASKGVPLAAYINKFLPARAIEASNRVLDTEFKLDVTEARGVTDTTTEKVTETVLEKPTKAKESLRKKIKLDKATTQKVVDAVVKTFGTKLPPVDSPQFKKALQKAFRTELKTTIAKDVLGSRAAYETFLRDNFENIYEAIPQDIINKRFRPFAEDTGKREKTKEGKKIFKKKDITKAEFINYFLGRDVGTSTKGTRKDALAEALAEEFAFDATMETIQKPEVIEKREFVDKTQTTKKVSEAIKRPIDLKFSKIAKLDLSYKQDFYQKLPEIAKAIEASNVNFKDKNSWKEIKSIVSPILGKDFPKLSEVSQDLQKYIKQYSEVKENYKNLDTLPEQSLDEFLFNETKAAETNTNIIKLLELGSVKMTTLFNNVDNIIKQRLFAKELGNHLINTGMKPAEVAKLFVSYYKGMYATSSKIGNGGIIVDKQGNVIKGNEKNIGTPRYQSFSNVNDFVNNVIKQIKGLENIQLTASGQVKNKQNIGGVIVDFNLFSETSKSAIQDKNFAGRKKQAKEARKSIDLMMSFMVDKVLDKKSIYTKEDLAMLMASMKSNMQGPIKRAANLKYIYEGKRVNVKDLRYEHMIPTNYVLLKLLDFYMNTKGSVRNSNVDKLFEQYTVAVIPKSMDQVLEKMKLTDVMPVNYFDGDPSYKRYYNIKTFGAPGVVAIKSIDPKDNGKVIGEKWVAAEKAFSKAKVYNEKILPPVIDKKFDKNTTNDQVLGEMEKLDKEASDARIKFSKSKDLNKDFNEIIERATGIGKEKQYGRTKARAVGADKGKFDLLGIPPSAQDFVGLTRYFAGKGKQGDKTIAWVKENFLDPFARANIDISNARVALANDFKALKKLLGVSPKDLNKKITGEPYTVGNAIRVYTWGQQGMSIPGLSKTDQKILEDYVTADENLQLFANELIAINKDNGYPKPTEGWLAGTITTDLLSGLNTVVRAKYLKQWQNNVDEVFNETNMNKLEAAYGKGYRDALENMLGRMKTGSNRGFKGDTLTGRFIDWINNSVGAIMFFNMRSAVLQTISAVNFVNWSDNNPLKAAAAFGNQPQYWSDVIKLMNSDYLVERRNGLKINVSEADIAEIAAESKNKAKAFVSKILKLGFLPTQIADSFAIASGGATFYRNRYKSLKKEGLSDKEAEAQAFQDFREIAEENQQSSRPDRISAQQAGPMGRIILAFANTPAQYARLMQKAASDLKNRRGDDKTNISKILYYGFIQNVMFNALQQALFAMAFADEEPDEEKKNKKYTSIVNGMADSLLRGVGFHGAAVSTLKNAIMKLAEGKEAQDAAIEMLDISPPISSKIGKLKSAGRTWDWNKKEIREKGWSLDNPAWLASGQVISAATNIPLDRGIRKLTNLKDASDAENEEWMRVANALGWQKWELEWTKDKPKKGKTKSFFKTPKINIPKIALPKF